MENLEQQSNQNYLQWMLIGLTVFAFIIRMVSIDHNLPYQIISDEGSDLTTSVRLLNGELPARHVRYHRSLIAYSNLIPIAGVFTVNFIDGDVRSIADFENLYFENRAEFIFATRLWMSLLASLAIYTTGLSASYINRKVGLLAALILCLNGFFFHTSLFALPDALAACMTSFAIWTMMRVWKYRRTRDYIVMSLALALVMLSKLQSAPIGIAFLIAHGYISYDIVNGDWKRLPLQYFKDKNFWIAAITGIIGNILFNPFAFIYWDDFIFEINRLETMFYSDVNPPLSYQINLSIAEMTNVVLVIWRWISVFLLLAFVPIWKNRQKAPYVMITAMMLLLPYTVLSSRLSPSSHFYYWNPVVIIMALMGGIGANYVLEFLQSLSKQHSKLIATSFVITMIVLEGSFLLRLFIVMNQETTQELAREWIVENLPADTAILTGESIVISVPLQRNEVSIYTAIEIEGAMLPQWNWYLQQSPESRPSPAYNLYGAEYVELVDSYDDLVQLVNDDNIEYAIFTDYACYDGDDDASNNSARAFPPRSDAIVENWELVFTASSYASGDCVAAIHPRTKLSFSRAIYQQVRMGPYIEIYRIP